jgi:hypothetical protein
MNAGFQTLAALQGVIKSISCILTFSEIKSLGFLVWNFRKKYAKDFEVGVVT